MPKLTLEGPELLAGEAIDECRREALARWLKDWRGQRSNEVMITQKLATEEISAINDRRRNRLNVWVTIHAKGGVPSYTEYHSYNRVRESAYRRIGESKM